MPTLLFLYGTLKYGQESNHLMAGQEFVRQAVTMPLYRLYSLGWHPGLVLDTTNGLAIQGELWSVDYDALRRLDAYEGCPHYFVRQDIAVAEHAGDVQAYFFNGRVPEDAVSGDRWPLPT